MFVYNEIKMVPWLPFSHTPSFHCLWYGTAIDMWEPENEEEPSAVPSHTDMYLFAPETSYFMYVVSKVH